MNEQGRKARAEYMRKYRATHKEELNKKRREDYKENPQKYKEWQKNYWARKGANEQRPN